MSKSVSSDELYESTRDFFSFDPKELSVLPSEHSRSANGVPDSHAGTFHNRETTYQLTGTALIGTASNQSNFSKNSEKVSGLERD